MERWSTPPGVPPAEVAAVVLAMFQDLAGQRRIALDRVSGDLFAQVCGGCSAGWVRPRLAWER